MKKTLTAKTYLPTLLIAVLILLVPTTLVYAASIDEWLYKTVVLGGFGKVLGWAGAILDYAINTFIVGFGNQMNGSIGYVVNTTWAIGRDLFNLTFIFGLVYIGFKMILRTDDSNSRKWLINIIIAALLVNFSLFISKFIIDFSNIVAVEIINMGLEPDSGLTGAVFHHDVEDGVTVVKISESMQERLGVVTTVGTEGSKPETSAKGAPKDVSMSMFIGTLLIFLVAAFVYFSAGIILIVRAAVLVVLMILSPFLFIGMVIPPFEGVAKQLWDALLKRSFLAPIYILFLFITLKLAETVFEGSFAGMFAASEGAAVPTNVSSSFGPFILVVALLVMSLVVAQKLGAEGASAAVGISNKIRQGAQARVKRTAIGAAKITAKGASMPLRYGVRKGLAAGGRKLKYGTLKAQQREKGLLGKVARSNIVGDHVLGRMAPALEGAKVGFKRDEESEQFMKMQSKLKADRRNDIERAGMEGGAVDRKAAFKNDGVLLGGTYIDAEGNERDDKTFEQLSAEEKQTHMLQLDKQIAEAEKAVKDTNPSEIANYPDQIKLKMTQFMDMATYEALQKNEDIPKTVREMMKEKMQEKIKSNFTRTITGADGKPQEQILTDELKKLKPKQIEALGTDWALDNAHLFTNSQTDEIERSNMMSDNFYEAFMDQRKGAQKQNVREFSVKYPNGLPKEIEGEAAIAALEGQPEQMMYKIKRAKIESQEEAEEYNAAIGDYVTTAKLKGGKDMATHLHQDAFKEKGFAPYASKEWAATFATLDRAKTKLTQEHRENIEKWQEKIMADAQNYNKETVERVRGNLEYLSNSQAQKTFYGVDKNAGGKNKSGDESTTSKSSRIVTEHGTPSQERERQNRDNNV